MNTIDFADEHLTIPKFTRGVYKMVLNDQWFYFGSSINLRSRLGAWKHYLSHGKPKNPNMRYLLPMITKVRFEILERVPKDIDPKTLEDQYIKSGWGNIDCLNLCPGAFDITGKTVGFGQGVRYKRKNPQTPAKKVGQFSKEGELIKIHDSLGLASFYLNGTRRAVEEISRVARGLSKHHLGFMFKFVNEDGSFIEPPKFIQKKAPKRPTVYKVIRPFLQITLDGEIVASYLNLRDYQNKTGKDKRPLWRILMGMRKTYKGHRYVYTDEYKPQEILTLF